MRTLILFISQPKVLLVAGSFAWFEIVVLPNPMLIFVLGGAMFIDLVTGLLKSWDQGKITTSSGLRKSVTKVTIYCCMIIATWLLTNLLKSMYAGIDYSWMVTWMINMLSLIELYSVFENIYAIAPDSMFSRHIIRPVMKAIRGIIVRADESLDAKINMQDGSEDNEDTPKN